MRDGVLRRKQTRRTLVALYMDRRTFFSIASIAALAALRRGDAQQTEKPHRPFETTNPSDLQQAPGVHPPVFALDELTISDLQSRMKQGSLNSERITGLYLQRIEEVDRRGPALRSVIEINSDALAIAR